MSVCPVRWIIEENFTIDQWLPCEELRPATWGLSCVLGDESNWDEMKTGLWHVASWLCPPVKGN